MLPPGSRARQAVTHVSSTSLHPHEVLDTLGNASLRREWPLKRQVGRRQRRKMLRRLQQLWYGMAAVGGSSGRWVSVNLVGCWGPQRREEPTHSLDNDTLVCVKKRRRRRREWESECARHQWSLHAHIVSQDRGREEREGGEGGGRGREREGEATIEANTTKRCKHAMPHYLPLTQHHSPLCWPYCRVCLSWEPSQ